MIDAYYQSKLTGLNVDRSSGHPKPHKVCLLFAVMDLIEDGKLTRNAITINEDLKAAFTRHFEKLKKGNDTNKITLPFYHLAGDGIWNFKVKPGHEAEFEALKAKTSSPSEKALFNVIDYAYLDEQIFGYFQNDLTRAEAKQILLENLEDLSVQFHRWLLAMGKSERTANSYVGAIKGTISNWAADANFTNQNLISIQSYSTINRVAEQLGTYSVFQEKNTKGKQMYSAALNAYRDFLASTCQVELTEDIEEIVRSRTIDDTQKARLVNTRIGQGQFREDLIRYWRGCAITGYQSVQFLLASHIKPWRVSSHEERLSVYNGILLLPNLDKAFDLGYITFSEKGAIKISEFVESPGILGIEQNQKITLTDQHQEFMAFHREEVFERKLQSSRL